MRTRIWGCLLFVLTLLTGTTVSAQSSTAGKDFWLSFPQNAKYEFGQSIRQSIVITALEDAEVAVTAPAMTGASQTIALGKKLRKGESYSFEIDSSFSCTTSEKVEGKAIHVGSTGSVTVLVSSNRKASNDSYRVMPIEALGKEYMVIGYDSPTTDGYFATQFTAIAAEDNTMLTIALTASTKGGRKNGEVINVKLDRAQCYTVQGKTVGNEKDLTGTIVTADKPIALVTGHMCAQVPYNYVYCDVLIEMAAPLRSAGTEFISAKMEDKHKYALRVLATQPNTTILLSHDPGINTDQDKATLNAGEYIDYNSVSVNRRLRSDKPIIVAQYALSNEGDSTRIGDPFMTLVAPTTAYSANITFSTPPVSGSWHHYLSIVCDQAAAGSLKIDGRSIPRSSGQAIDGSDYLIFQTGIEPGTKSITSDGRLAVYSYGFGYGSDNYDSYGTYCGPW